jgi:hypothetical protein
MLTEVSGNWIGMSKIFVLEIFCDFFGIFYGTLFLVLTESFLLDVLRLPAWFWMEILIVFG